MVISGCQEKHVDFTRSVIFNFRKIKNPDSEKWIKSINLFETKDEWLPIMMMNSAYIMYDYDTEVQLRSAFTSDYFF